MGSEAQRRQVDRNYDSFVRQLPTLMAQHLGQYALMRDGAVVDVFERPAEAYRTGLGRYADGLFSIQEVTDQPIDLGFFSHAAA